MMIKSQVLFATSVAALRVSMPAGQAGGEAVEVAAEPYIHNGVAFNPDDAQWAVDDKICFKLLTY